jgi:hypothetical protein
MSTQEIQNCKMSNIEYKEGSISSSMQKKREYALKKYINGQ